ncbi:MAG: hypothetical protein OER93_00225 [Thermoleophilia bacterium]|nr:hypothetical protein [Thermoleophilia bacterium]
MNDADDTALTSRIARVIATAHAQWSAPAERRRLRAFGFRPAVEAEVLKREWRGAQIRTSITGIVAVGDGAKLHYRAADGSLTVNEAPFLPAEHRDIANTLLDLIREYERWVEAREGREERIRRGVNISRDRRQVNALAETRRLQRVLDQLTPARGRR